MDDKIVFNLQDYRHLEWSRIRRSSGTAGSFLKSYENKRGTRIYYKLSEYDAFKGITGHECVNEIIADRLLTKLGVPHLPYQLVHALVSVDGIEYETWLCRSKDYKKPGESKIALDVFYQLEREPGESPLDFCLRLGWGRYVWQMLTVDFLISNRDRHGANIEVLRNREEKSFRPAPLFDHGLSFFFSAHSEEELSIEDPMNDKKIQCFVGSNSAFENLKLIPKEELLPPEQLSERDLDDILAGLDSIMPGLFRDKIRMMLWKRWLFYEDLRNS